MSLEVQIQSLIYSFVYGMFFALTLNLCYRFLFEGKRYQQILSNILFILFHTLFYFILLKYINQGVIHPYFLICLILGFVLGNQKTKFFRRKVK